MKKWEEGERTKQSLNLYFYQNARKSRKKPETLLYFLLREEYSPVFSIEYFAILLDEIVHWVSSKFDDEVILSKNEQS